MTGTDIAEVIGSAAYFYSAYEKNKAFLEGFT
jgi:hypothetical protein